jgi:hypothetical protein
MAQTGFTPIQLYRSTTGGTVPVTGNLAPGELAINIANTDMALFAENASGTVVRIMNNPAGLRYPTADGTVGQGVRTDGSGNLSFATFGDVTLTGTQTLTNKTTERLILNDGYTEEVFAITDGTTVNLDPNNGSIQTWTLGANRTPGQVNWAAGQSITLMIDDGTARIITWTTLAVVWETNGGTAPTLATSGFTVIVLWKVGTTIYGARVGDA